MNRPFWFLIAAISLSWFALDWMLDEPAPVMESRVRAEKSGERKSKPVAGITEKVGPPAASAGRQAAGKPIPQSPLASKPAESKPISKEGPPEPSTPLGVPEAELESIDMQAVEERVLAEQLAESLRNPAYLSGASLELSGLEEPEQVEEEGENPESGQASEPVDDIETGEDEIEEAPDDEVEDYASEPDATPLDEEQELMSEAEIPVDGESIDYNVEEEQVLDEQLEASQRSPAYLQVVEEEPPPEDSEEED